MRLHSPFFPLKLMHADSMLNKKSLRGTRRSFVAGCQRHEAQQICQSTSHVPALHRCCGQFVNPAMGVRAEGRPLWVCGLCTRGRFQSRRIQRHKKASARLQTIAVSRSRVQACLFARVDRLCWEHVGVSRVSRTNEDLTTVDMTYERVLWIRIH